MRKISGQAQITKLGFTMPQYRSQQVVLRCCSSAVLRSKKNLSNGAMLGEFGLNACTSDSCKQSPRSGKRRFLELDLAVFHVQGIGNGFVGHLSIVDV